MKPSVGYCPQPGVGDRMASAVPATGSIQPLSLRVNFSWIAAGNAVGALSQWGITIVLARLGSFDMVGTVGLAFAVCVPVGALSQLGLRGALVTDAKHEYCFGEYLALRLITAATALVVIFAIVLTRAYDAQTAQVIAVVAVAELLKSISDIFHARLQQHERMDHIGKAMILRGPLMLAALAAGVWLTGSLVWGMLGFALALAVVLVGYDLPSTARIARSTLDPHENSLRPQWNLRRLARLVWLTLPLGFVLMMVALATSIPRLMISHSLGDHALGVFIAIASVGAVGVRVVSALGQSAGPRLAKYHAAGNRAAYGRLLRRLTGLVAVIGAAAVGAMAVAGGPVLSRVYDADFTPHVSLAVSLTAAAAVMYLTMPLGIAVEAMRRFKTHMVIRAVGILVLSVATLLLIGDYGLQGAAVAMMLASGTTALGCVAVILYAMRQTKAGRTVIETQPRPVGR
ncbi:MAG TPA: oligosaccharide flippase family protein [Thermoguttaceae bacterium]|nr:oligosaccharide flippase family protein [Thermoguttaceae bacterium]